jgi:hypothetical protein
MADLKTQRNDANVAQFLAGVADAQRRADAEALCALMTRSPVSCPPCGDRASWAFGSYRYRWNRPGGRVAGRGSVPRKQSLTIYVAEGFGRFADL